MRKKLNVEIAALLQKNQDHIIQNWKQLLIEKTPQLIDLSGEREIDDITHSILQSYESALAQTDDFQAEVFDSLKEALQTILKDFAVKNIVATEVFIFISTLKQAIVSAVQDNEANHLEKSIYLHEVFEDLSLFMLDIYTQANEETVREQAKAIVEMSTPVVKIWNRIILLPLVGILDSGRAKKMMEALLTEIEESQAKIAILDISGIPIIDTLVARHLINTISAVKLMGADCILTGISSKISQTIVHLGLDLSDITTKGSLADGLQLALEITNQKIQ